MQDRALKMALAGAAMLACAASAASSRAAEIRRHPRRYRLGPLYVTPRLQLKNAGVDTNLFQTLRTPVRDAVVVLGARLDGLLPIGERLRLSGQAFVDRYDYRRQGQERSTDFYGRGDAVVELGSLRLFGGGGGGQFTQRLSIDVDERLKYQQKEAEAGAEWTLTSRLALSAQGSAEVQAFAPGTLRLGGAIQQALDRNTLLGSGLLRYRLTNRTALRLSAEVVEDRFFHAAAGIPPLRRSYRYLGGLEIDESASRTTPSGRLLFGLRQFPGTLAQGSPPYQGPAAAADVVVPLGRFGRFHAVGERDVRYASNLVAVGPLRYRNAFVYKRYLGEQLLALPAGLVGVVSAGFEEARYLLPHPYLSPTFLAARLDHRWTWSGGLSRRFGDSLRIGGHALWARRVSSLPLFSYQGWSYGLTAEVIP